MEICIPTPDRNGGLRHVGALEFISDTRREAVCYVDQINGRYVLTVIKEPGRFNAVIDEYSPTNAAEALAKLMMSHRGHALVVQPRRGAVLNGENADASVFMPGTFPSVVVRTG